MQTEEQKTGGLGTRLAYLYITPEHTTIVAVNLVHRPQIVSHLLQVRTTACIETAVILVLGETTGERH